MRVSKISALTLRQSRPLPIGGAIFLIYLAHALLVHGDVYVSGQMFNEAATNYFLKVRELGLASLLELDAGYWPLLLRIISLLIGIFPLTLQQIPFVYAAVSFFGPLFLLLPFLTSHYQVVVKQIWARGLIVMLLLITMDWESRQYINWTNLAVFTLFYVLARTLIAKQFDWRCFPLILLLLATKPVATMLSIPLAVSLWRIYGVKSKIATLIIILWAALGGLIILSSQLSKPSFVEANAPETIPVTTLLYTLKFFGAATIAPFQNQVPFIFQILLGLAFLLFVSWYHKAYLKTSVLITAIYLATCNLFALVLGSPIPWNFEYLDENKVWFFRQFTPFWVAFFLLTVPLLFDLLSRKLSDRPTLKFLLSTLTIFLVSLSFMYKPLVEINPVLSRGSVTDVGLTEWVTHSERQGLVSKAIEGRTCVAVNPFLTSFGQGCVAKRMLEKTSYVGGQKNFNVLVGEPSTLIAVYVVSSRTSLPHLSLLVDDRNVDWRFESVSAPGAEEIFKIIPEQPARGALVSLGIAPPFSLDVEPFALLSTN